ncbi:MAG: phosphatidylserine/phosphatidylglycerophosphate/cardiolipin synthase family protein [Candidatus Gastranaerophilaceae bacterium]
MKIKSFIILFAIFLFILVFNKFNETTYQAMEISDDCKIGIDINKNGSITDKEFFEIKDIIPYCSAENLTKNTSVSGDINKNGKIFLHQKTLDFYKKLFLNSSIRIHNGQIFVNFQDAAILVLKSGLAHTMSEKHKQYENIIEFEKLKNEGNSKLYYILNLQSYKYHALDCKHGISSVKKKYVTVDELPKKAQPCKYCLSPTIKTQINKKLYSKIIENTNSSSNIKIIESISTEVFKPNQRCDTKICQSLKTEIDKAQNSIDMAVYELRNQPIITDALIKAKNRGVKIRIATDKTYNPNFQETENIAKNFSDIIITDEKPEKYSNKLMHNKFFIFDNHTVWTGSTNITDTGLSGFNTNSVIVIKSKDIAEIYLNEFENFMQNKFHSVKKQTKTNSVIIDKSKISVTFSPQDRTITNKIIPAIKNAKNYIYIPAFIITDKELQAELINAKNRGIDIKLIIDATSASNRYSVHTGLRNNNISVKVENFAGKMHMKSILIDDKIAFLGSMNFTKSGNQYNDENSIEIEDEDIVKYLKANFLQLWNKIPDIYLTRNPSAEGFESIGSCFDGIDNDYDGYIDSLDSGCKAK